MDRVEHLKTIATAAVIVDVNRQIGRVGVALRDLLHDGVVLVLSAGHFHVHAVSDEEIAAGGRHCEVDVLLDQITDRAGIAAAVAYTDKYHLLAHRFLLLNFLSHTYYAAHRPAVRALLFRGE